MTKEDFLMKVWNNLVEYLEDIQPDMSKVEKLKFAQGYLHGLQMCSGSGTFLHRDYKKFMNEITDLIVKDLI